MNKSQYIQNIHLSIDKNSFQYVFYVYNNNNNQQSNKPCRARFVMHALHLHEFFTLESEPR